MIKKDNYIVAKLRKSAKAKNYKQPTSMTTTTTTDQTTKDTNSKLSQEAVTNTSQIKTHLYKDDHIEHRCQAEPSVDGEKSYKTKGCLDKLLLIILS